jgi:hypothetical protein
LFKRKTGSDEVLSGLNLQEEFGESEAGKPDRCGSARRKELKVNSCNRLGLAPIRPHGNAIGLPLLRSRPGPQRLFPILFDAVQTCTTDQD